MIHTVWPGLEAPGVAFFLHFWFASYRVFWEKVHLTVARVGQARPWQEITS